jgi:hypothetical protein
MHSLCYNHFLNLELPNMIRKPLFILLVYIIALQSAPWREMKLFVLKKDELARVLIKTQEGKQEKVRILQWRWTLYTDKRLVVHEKFDRVVGQNVLTAGRNDSFKKNLLPPRIGERDRASAVVVFKKFDEQNQTAIFDLLIFDKEKRVLVDYFDKDKKQ